MREAIERVLAELQKENRRLIEDLPRNFVEALGRTDWIYSAVRAEVYQKVIERLKGVLAEHETGDTGHAPQP